MENRLAGEILNACNELIDSARELVRETLPHTPLPEPVVFVIADGIFWPAQVKGLRLSEALLLFSDEEGRLYSCSPQLAFRLYRSANERSDEVERIVRTLRSATEWCRQERRRRLEKARKILEEQADDLAYLLFLAFVLGFHAFSDFMNDENTRRNR